MASQCDRVLTVLSDCKPHRMEEIHQRVGFCRLNSRVAELRKKGHLIECEKKGGHYTYQLVGRTGPAHPDPEPVADQDGQLLLV